MLHYRTLQAPISVQIELTESCTNDCIHCYNHWRTEKADKFASASVADMRIIMNQLMENNVFSVNFTGGEPLLNKDALFIAIDMARDNGIEFTLNSNLVLLTPELAEKLRYKGLQSVLTSLMSYNETTHNDIAGHPNAYKKTVTGIHNALAAGLKVTVNMVIMKANLSHLYQAGQFAVELGASAFTATKVVPALNCRDFRKMRLDGKEVIHSLDILLEIEQDFNIAVDILECYPLCLFKNIEKYQHFARRGCAAGITTLTVGANGFVRPCSHSDMTYGNILEELLTTIWLNMQDWRDGHYLPNICQQCKYLAYCTGGCRMEAKYFGKITDLDPYASSPKNVKPLSKSHKLPPA